LGRFGGVVPNFAFNKGAKAPPIAARPDDPNPHLGHSWVVLEGWSQILLSTKLFRHGFDQSCSAMATQKRYSTTERKKENTMNL